MILRTWKSHLEPLVMKMMVKIIRYSAKCLCAVLAAASPCLKEAVGQDALDAMRNFSVPSGLKIELFADGRYLANPVAFCFDDAGRVYVAETFRMYHGVEENRRGEEWLNDDLACQSIPDRLDMLKKWAKEFEGGWDYFKSHSEQVRLLVDTNSDGRVDRSTIFSTDYDDPLDGLAAGVLAGDRMIYFGCVPNIYRLQDADRDGHAEQRDVLLHGFGVRHAFIGHDLHGLIWGPDGKLYFSMGDRGFHVETKEGEILHSPNRGAILRCDPSGTSLEVFATGLRNPQEIAFDKYGNLFTCDNNSDAGDQARVVYLPEWSDSGWRMEYQYLEGDNLRGPWTQEKLWHPQHRDQPAWILPPLAWIGAGPSGLTYYPGIGLPDRYDDHFFMCDYRADQQSSIRSFAVRPQGAGFEMVDEHEFWQQIAASDVEFGYDGRLYALDFIEGWNGTGKGRIYRVFDPAKANSPVIKSLPGLFRRGFTSLSTEKLLELLHHKDMRVRLRSQFALAAQGTEAVHDLIGLLRESDDTLAQLHVIWGLGQIARKETSVLRHVIEQLENPNAHIRAQAAKTLGDHRYLAAFDRLVNLIDDENLQVRAAVCMALGKIGDPVAVEPILDMLEKNQDNDVFLRHAGVMGLTGIGDVKVLIKHANHPSAAVRLGILLALRRLADPHVGRFLDDADPRIVLEAARAIHDVPISAALPQLAQVIARFFQPVNASEGLVVPSLASMRFNREFWHDIEGSRVADLTNHPRFKSDTPDETDTITVFTNGPERGANYGTRIRGLLQPPETGEYTFFFTSDDEGQLFLSGNEDPAGKRLIASVATYAIRDRWDMCDTQVSEAIQLEKGRRYYIEALHKEGGSPDHLAVGWQLPDGTIQRPIGSNTAIRASNGLDSLAQTALLRRLINANFRLGGRQQALAVANLVSNRAVPPGIRRLAAQALVDWIEPPPRDAVLGHRQYLSSRDAAVVRDALDTTMAAMLRTADGELEGQVAKLAATYQFATDPDTFVSWALDGKRTFAARRQAIRLLAKQGHARLSEIIKVWLQDASPEIRSEARWILASHDSDRAVEELADALFGGAFIEKQAAMETLAAMEHPAADQLLIGWTKQLVEGHVPGGLQLDVLEAARRRGTPELQELVELYEENQSHSSPTDRYKIALSGGDVVRGEHTFFTNSKLRCQRCHQIGGSGGGEVGPDLTGIGAVKSREYILQSIVTPNQQFAEGFAYATVITDEGLSITGRVVRQSENLLVIQPTGKDELVVFRDEIEDQVAAQSAMPANLAEQMTLRELRDLVEFLARQTKQQSDPSLRTRNGTACGTESR